MPGDLFDQFIYIYSRIYWSAKSPSIIIDADHYCT